MTRIIPYRRMVILLIGISVIGTVSVWFVVNNFGAAVPATSLSAGGSEGGVAGSGQVRLIILKPENESSTSNKSFQRHTREGFG